MKSTAVAQNFEFTAANQLLCKQPVNALHISTTLTDNIVIFLPQDKMSIDTKNIQIIDQELFLRKMSAAQDDKIPWKEGFWKMEGFNAMLLKTCGANQLSWKNLVALDFPHLENAWHNNLICKFGNKGKAREEIKSATGTEEYNIHIKSSFFDACGVLNEEGTKITIVGLTNKVEEWEWLDEERVNKLLENRDSYQAPRYRNLCQSSN